MLCQVDSFSLKDNLSTTVNVFTFYVCHIDREVFLDFIQTVHGDKQSPCTHLTDDHFIANIIFPFRIMSCHCDWLWLENVSQLQVIHGRFDHIFTVVYCYCWFIRTVIARRHGVFFGCFCELSTRHSPVRERMMSWGILGWGMGGGTPSDRK